MYKSCKISVVCVPFSQKTEIVLPREVQTGCGIHPVSYSMSIGRTLSPGVKWLGLDADYLPLSSAEVKDDSPLCLQGVYRDSSTFYLRPTFNSSF
jgi:hypothetical protein